MKYTRLVEKYLDGELKGEELSSFEREILKNPEVAEEVERVRNLDAFSRKHFDVLTSTRDLLEDTDDMNYSAEECSFNDDLENIKIQKIYESDPDYLDFRKKVKTISLKNYLRVTTKDKVLVPGYIIWLVAASFAILLAFTFLNIFTGNKPGDNHDIFANFYNPYPADLVVRNTTDVPDDLFTKGLDEYNLYNFGSALSYFNSVESGNIKNNSINLLKGICLIETGDFEAGIQEFGKLTGDPVLNDYGLWYTGLCYIELGLPEKARDLFKELSGRDGYFEKTAKRILKDL
jgi:tetratricopeptide (TPR) repeat protein